jgi:hypothetical protein
MILLSTTSATLSSQPSALLAKTTALTSAAEAARREALNASGFLIARTFRAPQQKMRFASRSGSSDIGTSSTPQI